MTSDEQIREIKRIMINGKIFEKAMREIVYDGNSKIDKLLEDKSFMKKHINKFIDAWQEKIQNHKKRDKIYFGEDNECYQISK